MGVHAALVATALVELLRTFVRTKQLGKVACETLFRLGPDGPDRRPDVAFVHSDRVRTAPVAQDSAAWAVVPNLAVEVIGPTNTAADVQEKLNDYSRAGVEVVWVIFPAQRQVMVYESLGSAHGIQEPGSLPSGTLLAGFTLSLSELFADLTDTPPP